MTKNLQATITLDSQYDDGSSYRILYTHDLDLIQIETRSDPASEWMPMVCHLGTADAEMLATAIQKIQKLREIF